MLSNPFPVYRLSPTVAIESFGDRALALHCTRVQLVELNATAQELIARLDGKTSLQEIAAAMARDYAVPLETVLADIEAVVRQMCALEVLEVVPPAAGNSLGPAT